MKKWIARGLLAILSFWGLASQVQADPDLQMYIEGSTYNTGTETWVSTGPNTFRLWVIGNTTSANLKGAALQKVLLVAVYDHAPGVSITITPTKVGGTGTYTASVINGTVIDPSIPAGVVPTGSLGSPYAPGPYTATGGSPMMYNGNNLPNHGEFGVGRTWVEFGLGDFTLKDSPIGDFTGPNPPNINLTPNSAQINAYDITVTGTTSIHFDAFGFYVDKKTHNVFVPFSHDAEWNAPPPPVPEPSSIVLGLVGVVGLGLARLRRLLRRNALALA